MYFTAVAAVSCRYANTLSNETVEKHRTSTLAHDKEQKEEKKISAPAPPGLKWASLSFLPLLTSFPCRHVHPEFLPNPTFYRRDRIKEKLERQDMYRRRAVCPIPEFYVGKSPVLDIFTDSISLVYRLHHGCYISRPLCKRQDQSFCRNLHPTCQLWPQGEFHVEECSRQPRWDELCTMIFWPPLASW